MSKHSPKGPIYGPAKPLQEIVSFGYESSFLLLALAVYLDHSTVEGLYDRQLNDHLNLSYISSLALATEHTTDRIIEHLSELYQSTMSF